MDTTAQPSDASVSEYEQRVRSKPPVRWHMYHTLAAWVAGPAALAVYLAGVAVGVGEGVLVWAVLFPVGAAVAVTGVAALWAFYADGTDDWAPWWPLWLGAALLVGTPFVAPVYLLRRRLAVGPADYSGTYIDAVSTAIRG